MITEPSGYRELYWGGLAAGLVGFFHRFLAGCPVHVEGSGDSGDVDFAFVVTLEQIGLLAKK